MGPTVVMAMAMAAAVVRSLSEIITAKANSSYLHEAILMVIGRVCKCLMIMATGKKKRIHRLEIGKAVGGDGGSGGK